MRLVLEPLVRTRSRYFTPRNHTANLFSFLGLIQNKTYEIYTLLRISTVLTFPMITTDVLKKKYLKVFKKIFVVEPH